MTQAVNPNNINTILNAANDHHNTHGTNNVDPITGMPTYMPILYQNEDVIDTAVRQAAPNTPFTSPCLCGWYNTAYRVRMENNHVYDIVLNNQGVAVSTHYLYTI